MTLALLKSERQNDSFLNGTRKKEEKARGSIEGNGDGERGNTQMTIRVVNIKRFRTYNYFHDCFISQYFDQLVNDLFKHKSGQNALHQFQEHRMTSVKWLIKTVKKKKKKKWRRRRHLWVGCFVCLEGTASLALLKIAISALTHQTSISDLVATNCNLWSFSRQLTSSSVLPPCERKYLFTPPRGVSLCSLFAVITASNWEYVWQHDAGTGKQTEVKNKGQALEFSPSFEILLYSLTGGVCHRFSWSVGWKAENKGQRMATLQDIPQKLNSWTWSIRALEALISCLFLSLFK